MGKRGPKPRPEGDLRQLLTVRVNPETLELLDGYAKATDTNRGRAVDDAAKLLPKRRAKDK